MEWCRLSVEWVEPIQPGNFSQSADSAGFDGRSSQPRRELIKSLRGETGVSVAFAFSAICHGLRAVIGVCWFAAPPAHADDPVP